MGHAVINRQVYPFDVFYVGVGYLMHLGDKM